jgi:hypothetical protein
MIQEVIQVPTTIISNGKKSTKKLFYNEVIINQKAR